MGKKGFKIGSLFIGWVSDDEPAVTTAPVNQAPANQAPANQAPANQAPANQAPANQAPVNQAPANQAPANQAPVNQAPANQAPVNQAPAKKVPDWFWITLLLVVIAVLLIWLFKTAPLSTATPAGGSSSNTPVSAPASPNNEVWKAVLTSANSNGKFIADLGGYGTGAVIPETATDLQGETWQIGRVLLTYCENASSCYYMFGKPGDRLERAFNVNAYTPQFTGDLTEELQYIDVGWNNNEDVVWTPVQ